MYIVRNVVTLFNIILFIICSMNNLNSIMGFNTVFVYFLIIFVFILTLLDMFKKNNHINLNNKYNFVFIVSNLSIMLIFLRGIFDQNIIVNVFKKFTSERMLFVGNNLIYINIIYLCLILYRYTISKPQ